jgi:hypothetical protein
MQELGQQVGTGCAAQLIQRHKVGDWAFTPLWKFGIVVRQLFQSWPRIRRRSPSALKDLEHLIAVETSRPRKNVSSRSTHSILKNKK